VSHLTVHNLVLPRSDIPIVPNITVHCVRHAQGYHNLSDEDHILPDPSLTEQGEAQCGALQKIFPYHDKVTHLVASPLRRTLYTCLLSFGEEVKSGKKVIALPELQETSDLPCDTGSDPAKLQEEFGAGQWMETVDLSLVHEGWNDKSLNTKWAPSATKIEVRAREARIWLRDLAMKSSIDAEIVVVTHGGYLHYFTEDWTGHVKSAGEQIPSPAYLSGFET
jgi:broad specificity phosphatase PhoE